MPFLSGFAQSRAFGRGGAGKLPVFTTSTSLGFLKNGFSASANLAQIIATVGAGDPPVISYSIISGTLPTGVTFNSNGTWSGTASGINTIETRSFTIRVTSAAGFTDKTFTMDLETTPTGQAAYTSPGTYTWTAPTAVRSVCVVCVGGGGGGGNSWASAGGGGAGLGWKNNIVVTPGQEYTVVVGDRGQRNALSAGGNSYFNSIGTVAGYGGGNQSSGAYTYGPNANSSDGGGYVGDGGGAGGSSGTWAGGAGAGGYTNRGGNTNEDWRYNGGGGGGGGDYYSSTYGTGAGGGVGINGRGSDNQGSYLPWTGYYNTAGPNWGGGGDGGSGGAMGYYGQNPWSSYSQSWDNILGGDYGGGGGGAGTNSGGGNGGIGAVRIIWGDGRSFPNTNTGNL